ncbi:MAG TPA: GNAT family N-acetyltransferase [Rubrivivax sp.]|jgi:GNAT superfamily N-acetyltransferase|nr:GNAT family N-acetyltransferase [Rubrivivax sp.]
MRPSPPTLQIRAARAADAARVARCFLASRKLLLGIAPLHRTDEQVAQWVQDSLLPSTTVSIAVESGAVVGFIALAERMDGPWIDQLYVHPARLRRGIGSTLLQVTLMRLKGAVRLYTFKENHNARQFFERYGFTPIAFGDGSSNESGSPDVLYEREAARTG